MCDLYQVMLLDHDLSEETRVMDQVPGNLTSCWPESPQTWGNPAPIIGALFEES